jgi:hypothetical protein
MATFAMKRRAVTLFKNGFMGKSTQRHNMISWLNAVETLGDKWLLYPKIKKII